MLCPYHKNKTNDDDKDGRELLEVMDMFMA